MISRKSRDAVLALLLSFSLFFTLASSFVLEYASSLSRSAEGSRLGTLARRNIHVLSVLKDPQKSDNNSEDSEDSIEEARRKLLASMGGNDDDKKDKSSNTLRDWREQLQKAPPLTTVGRERLQVEMNLLRCLANDDANEDISIRNLWYFWYNERGRNNTASLMAADQLVHEGTPESRKQAEALYRQIIAQEGLNWCEPLNRLATLLFYEERYEEAKDLCQMVLTLKPWHFGCRVGIVQVCEKLGDSNGVEYYSRWRMPPLRGDEVNKERNEWLTFMLEKAQAKLDKGEKALKEVFEAADIDNISETGSKEKPDEEEKDEDESAWE